VFVVAIREQRFGFIWLMEHVSDQGAKVIDIHAVSVLPARRGMGYGRQLVRHALDFVDREFPTHGMTATCHPQSTVMMSMLEHYGFNPLEATPEATQYLRAHRSA
jgi:GNAT superfamily N-acetyltransferase